MRDIKGKTGIVTGASGGIGSELVSALDAEGVTTIRIEKTAGGEPNEFGCDLSDRGAVEKLAEDIISKYQKIDFLYNVAGIGIHKEIGDLTIDEWYASININLNAPFILTKLLLPKISQSEDAMIFNVGSGMGKVPSAGRSSYCATKFGLRGFSLSLAKEFGGRGVDFCHLTLGSVMTGFGTGGIELRKSLEKGGKKYLSPEEVAQKILGITKEQIRKPEYEMYPEGYNDNENSN